MSMKVSGHSPGKNGLVMLTSPEAKFEPDIKLVPLEPPVKTETLDNLQREVMELKALLKKKSVETKRLRGEIERLQAQARMNNAATEALLEENESLRREQIKIEHRAPRLHDALEHTEVIEIFDSEDEDQDPNDFADRNRGRPRITAPSRPLRNSVAAEALRTPSLTASGSSALSRSSVPPGLDMDQDMTDDYLSSEESSLSSDESRPASPEQDPVPNQIKREGTIDVDEVELIEVKVKQEDGSEQFKYVHLMKSEDGLYDVFNTDGFDLGQRIKIDTMYNIGWSRKVISDAFFGGHQTCFHNWAGKKAKGQPYLTFKRSWNHALPTAPGQHGIVFTTFLNFNDGSVVNRPLHFFVGEGKNDWRYYGSYDLKRWGEISHTHLKFLPEYVLQNWIQGVLKSKWGQNWVEGTNKSIAKKAKKARRRPVLIPYTQQGVNNALQTGLLTIGFTIMECVGFDYDWYERLVYSKAHPKPPKEKKDKDGEATSKKRKAKGDTAVQRLRKRTKVVVASDGQADGPSEEGGLGSQESSDASDNGQPIMTPPSSRSSLRLPTKQKNPRAISVEL